jgi:hypothetical protein
MVKKAKEKTHFFFFLEGQVIRKNLVVLVSFVLFASVCIFLLSFAQLGCEDLGVACCVAAPDCLNLCSSLLHEGDEGCEGGQHSADASHLLWVVNLEGPGAVLLEVPDIWDSPHLVCVAVEGAAHRHLLCVKQELPVKVAQVAPAEAQDEEAELVLAELQAHITWPEGVCDGQLAHEGVPDLTDVEARAALVEDFKEAGLAKPGGVWLLVLILLVIVLLVLLLCCCVEVLLLAHLLAAAGAGALLLGAKPAGDAGEVEVVGAGEDNAAGLGGDDFLVADCALAGLRCRRSRHGVCLKWWGLIH